MDFLYSYIALAEIYVLLGLSTNLLVGIAGIFSVSQAAVFGVGAYIVAFCLMHGVMGFVPALLVGLGLLPGLLADHAGPLRPVAARHPGG